MFGGEDGSSSTPLSRVTDWTAIPTLVGWGTSKPQDELCTPIWSIYCLHGECLHSPGLPGTTKGVTKSNRNILSPSSGAWKARIKVGRAAPPLKVLGEDPSLPLPGFSGCCNPWRSPACSCSTTVSASIITWPSPHMCLCFWLSSPCLTRTPVTLD